MLSLLAQRVHAFLQWRFGRVLLAHQPEELTHLGPVASAEDNPLSPASHHQGALQLIQLSKRVIFGHK